jgi:predicted ATPase
MTAAVPPLGATPGQTWQRSVLAFVRAHAGGIDDALENLVALKEWESRSSERFFEAETRRLWGEIELMRKPPRQYEAEQLFREAIEKARVSGAKLFELRATMSLARLLVSQGHRDEARRMLADIYNWFTEGFDTADLRDAKALLDELSV